MFIKLAHVCVVTVAVSCSVHAHAEDCSDKIDPGKTSFADAFNCIKDITKGKEIQKTPFRIELIFGTKDVAKKRSQDLNFEAVSPDCPTNTTLINAYCQMGGDNDLRPAGGGALQNRGLAADGHYHCIWNSADPNSFRAWIQPVCARIVAK